MRYTHCYDDIRRLHCWLHSGWHWAWIDCERRPKIGDHKGATFNSYQLFYYDSGASSSPVITFVHGWDTVLQRLQTPIRALQSSLSCPGLAPIDPILARQVPCTSPRVSIIRSRITRSLVNPKDKPCGMEYRH